MASFLRFAALVAALGVACTVGRRDEAGALASAQTAGGLPCDVDDVLARRCRGCHGATPTFGAPMPLVTHADLTAPSTIVPGATVYARVGQRVHADVRPMPPPPNERLSPADLDTIDRWIAAGAPAGGEPPGRDGPACAGADAGTATPLSCVPDVQVRGAAAWPMPEEADDAYVCYGFDVTSASRRHVVGIAPHIDNPAIVHHLLLFQSSSAFGATPKRCSSATPLDWRVVYGWAPGGGNFELPPEAGYPQPETTHYVVQVHYNNVLHQRGQLDASGFGLCTTAELRPNDADTVAFGTTSFVIPPRANLDISCDVKLPQALPALHFFAAFPHMHQLGTTIATKKLGQNGAPDRDMGTRTSWDFQTQSYLPIDVVASGGDVVRTRCAWSNPGDTAVPFGEDTADEMCFSFSMYWPRVAAWSWMAPSAMSRCRPTTP